jgi:xanthine dehydrogenase large subunit
VPLAQVRGSASDTSKVPNASPTAASSGSDLNGMAAERAAATVRERLIAFAGKRFGCGAETVEIRDGVVSAGTTTLPFAELARLAYFARVPLFATGFYATPKVHYDKQTLSGRPFFYFAYGAAVSEVAIDTLTGEHCLLAVDILHDAGRSLNPAIDRGQVEGGFLQGYGWLTMEELWWDAKGRLGTHAPSTYKIPTAHDCPAALRIDFWDEPNREDTIHRSKAVGEPPLMLALSAFHALRDAIASVAEQRVVPRLDAPATPERVLAAVEDVRARAATPPASKARGARSTAGVSAARES